MICKIKIIRKSTEQKIDPLLHKLKHERNELHMHMPFIHSKAKDEWEELEKMWHQLTRRVRKAKIQLNAVGDASRDSSKKVDESLHPLLVEVGTGYHNIRRKLHI